MLHQDHTRIEKEVIDPVVERTTGSEDPIVLLLSVQVNGWIRRTMGRQEEYREGNTIAPDQRKMTRSALGILLSNIEGFEDDPENASTVENVFRLLSGLCPAEVVGTKRLVALWNAAVERGSAALEIADADALRDATIDLIGYCMLGRRVVPPGIFDTPASTLHHAVRPSDWPGFRAWLMTWHGECAAFLLSSAECDRRLAGARLPRGADRDVIIGDVVYNVGRRYLRALQTGTFRWNSTLETWLDACISTEIAYQIRRYLPPPTVTPEEILQPSQAYRKFARGTDRVAAYVGSNHLRSPQAITVTRQAEAAWTPECGKFLLKLLNALVRDEAFGDAFEASAEKIIICARAKRNLSVRNRLLLELYLGDQTLLPMSQRASGEEESMGGVEIEKPDMGTKMRYLAVEVKIDLLRKLGVTPDCRPDFCLFDHTWDRLLSLRPVKERAWQEETAKECRCSVEEVRHFLRRFFQAGH